MVSKVILSIVIGYALLILWVHHELKHAPTVDDDGNVIDE